MALTQSVYYANVNQPRLAVRAVLRDPLAREVLRRLRDRSLPLSEAAETLTERQILRRLVRLDLVSAYALGGKTKYRARRLGVYACSLLVDTVNDEG